LVSAGLVACSDDTAVTGAQDAAPDQTADVSTNDTGTTDAGDAGTDAPIDAPIDAPTLTQLPPAIAQAICTRVLTCCGQGGGADSGAFDGGVFDLAACLKLYGSTGWDNSLAGTEIPGVADGGHLVYDPTEGNNCITRINNGGPVDGGKFTCGTMQAAELKAISVACFAAVKGNIPVGTAGCRASVECVPGAYCAAAGGGAPDGGATGTCTALKAVGDNCDNSPALGELGASDQCSYRGSGEACLPPADGVPRTCTALRAAGEVCVSANEECQSGLCDDNGKCGSSVTFITQPYCAQFVDAGL
jgi:hypothetical protein